MFHNPYPAIPSPSIQTIWGGALPAENVRVTLSAARDATFNFVHYDIQVKARPVVVPVSLRDSTAHIQVPRHPLKVTLRHTVSTFTDPAVDLGLLLVYQISPRVYEADPRIGSCEQHYAPLPLFDPPLGVLGMRQISGCTLCGIVGPDPEGAGYRAWGGGNIGWVHPTCLVRVYA
jgi:hypothetical protein